MITGIIGSNADGFFIGGHASDDGAIFLMGEKNCFKFLSALLQSTRPWVIEDTKVKKIRKNFRFYRQNFTSHRR